jgi:hypothetical protein
MSNLKIKIYPVENEYFDYLEKPYPSSSRNPEWIKKTPMYYTEKKDIDGFNMPTSTIKNCMPVRDMIGCGFIIPLPCDVWVEKIKSEDGTDITNFRWALNNINLIQPHVKEQSDGIPVLDGFEKTPYKFNNFWIIETPKNWSCIFKHPSYYDDLPFRILDGLVDTDKYPLSVNFPFFIKNGFTGLIEKGTPIAQVIPFKRENFNAQFYKYNSNLLFKWYKASSNFFNIYKRHFRTKKNFKISKCPFR